MHATHEVATYLHYPEGRYVMNASELRWLLQTVEKPETLERFITAEYERTRISYEMIADIAREHCWITSWRMNSLLPFHLTEYGTSSNDLASNFWRSNAP